MAVLRIDVVDSATASTSNSVTLPNGSYLQYDTMIRLPTDISYATNTISADKNSWVYSCGWTIFKNEDLNFLNTAQIQSMKLHFRVATAVMGTGGVYLSYPTQRLAQGTVYGSWAMIKSRIPIGNAGPIETGKDYEYEFNSLETLKNVVKWGLLFWTEKVSTSLCYYVYGARATVNFRPYIEIEYLDSNTPSVVTATHPRLDVIDNSVDNQFSFSYSQAVNQPQSHVDLQGLIGGSWTDIYAKEATQATSLLVPAYTFPTGENQWRVRTWTKEGTIASDWSEAPFIARSAPEKPNITEISSTPKSKIIWQVSEQSGFQVQVGGYTSNAIYGVEREYVVPFLLEEGPVEFRVRIVNSEGVWSDWAESTAVIENHEEEPILLTASSNRSASVRLAWTTEGKYIAFLIYRDGEPIGQTRETTYIDYFACGKHEYFVRGIHEEDSWYFTDSPKTVRTLKVENAVISPVDNIDWLKLEKRRQGRPVHSFDARPSVSYRHYEGRKLPIGYKSEQQDRTHQITFTLKSRNEYERLLSMLNETVIYKDCYGEKIIGNLDSLPTTIDRVYDFEIGITETEYSERVSFDFSYDDPDDGGSEGGGEDEEGEQNLP